MLYVLTPAWATSGALHVYDTRDKKLSFVMPANDVIVLSACKSQEYRDNLVVQQHRYFVVAGSYDWYWLYDRTGKREKGPLGDFDGEEAVREAIERRRHCASGDRSSSCDQFGSACLRSSATRRIALVLVGTGGELHGEPLGGLRRHLRQDVGHAARR